MLLGPECIVRHVTCSRSVIGKSTYRPLLPSKNSVPFTTTRWAGKLTPQAKVDVHTSTCIQRKRKQCELQECCATMNPTSARGAAIKSSAHIHVHEHIGTPTPGTVRPPANYKFDAGETLQRRSNTAARRAVRCRAAPVSSLARREPPRRFGRSLPAQRGESLFQKPGYAATPDPCRQLHKPKKRKHPSHTSTCSPPLGIASR